MTTNKIVVLNNGKFQQTDSNKYDYEFVHPSDFFAYPTNLTPKLSSVSGSRVVLGAKSWLQAISLPNREVPLVQSVKHEGAKSFNDIIGQEFMSVRAQEAGTVTNLTDHNIEVKSDKGKTHTYDLYHNHNLGQKSFITSYPKVKVGDKVKKDDIIAYSNYTDKEGNLAMGVNLRTAVMPYRSGNFEDAVCLSTSGAAKLGASQMFSFRLEERLGVELDKNKYISVFPNVYYNNQIEKIDSGGVIKKGSVVNHGDPIFLATAPKVLRSSDLALGKLSSALKHAFMDQSVTWEHEAPGTVVEVVKSSNFVTVNIMATRPLEVGDKLCLTPDHDVLTDTGWKSITQVTDKDKFASLRPATKLLEYVEGGVVNFPVQNEEMLSIHSKEIDTTVTLNHRLFVQLPEAQNYKLIDAEDLIHKNYKMFRSASRWEGDELKVATIKTELGEHYFAYPDYLPVLAAFIVFGRFEKNIDEVDFVIRTYQPTKLTCIKKLLKALGFPYLLLNDKASSRGLRITDRGINNHFRDIVMEYNRGIPNEVFLADRQDLLTFYQYLIYFGGVAKDDCDDYLTTPYECLANDFQRLCLHVGFCGVIEPSPTSSRYVVNVSVLHNRPEINKEDIVEASGHQDHIVKYNGRVYCLVLKENHVFYVRRNGKPYWTGNSNAWGAKGVCTIISDSVAPRSADGKPVDVILNSMSITSRVAPSLLCSLALGKVAQKTGKVIKVPQFTKGSLVDHTQAELKKHGISETETLYDPTTGRNIDVTVGPLYFQRLTHSSEDKISGKGQGSAYDLNYQPSKGGDNENSKRIGNLSTNCLLSSGSTAVLRDIATVKATKNDEFWRALKLGLPAPSPKVPFIFNKFIASLIGSGINVTKKGSIFQILPQTDKDILKLSAGAIDHPIPFQVKGEKFIPEKGGMFDPEKTGVLGERYNHVNLGYAVPNPISEDYLRTLLGVTKDNYLKMVVDGSLAPKLASYNIDTELDKYKKYLKSGKKTDRDKAVKLIAFLQALKDNKMQVKDLMLTKVPIIPAMYRPVTVQGDFTLSADANYLYKDLILTSNELKKDLKDVPPEIVDKLKAKQYDAIKAVYGLGESVTPKNKEKGIKGLLATTLGLQGGSAKSTMFQSKVVNKPLDLVGRAVLAPTAQLDIDEAYVPVELLWKMYAPFVTRRLVQKGIPALKAQEYIKSRNLLATEALNEELKVRPGIISRDPALHKFNLMGFYLKPNPSKKDNTIKLNPLVFKGFGADNDGDQLNVNVPAGDDARDEVVNKLLPSKNLLSVKSFQPTQIPSNEAALGMYQASKAMSNKAAKKYNSAKDVVSAFNAGHLGIEDNVEIN